MGDKKQVLLLGGLLMDRYVVVEEYPRRGEDTLVSREFQKVGGCPFNVAVTLQNLGLSPVIYSALGGAMGRDLGRALEERGLSREGTYLLPGEAAGYCMILLDREGERTFFTRRGCEGHFDPARVPAGALAASEVIFVTGIYLVYPRWSGLAVDFLERQAARGKRIVFDPGPLLAQIELPLLRRMLEISWLITPNTGELEAMEEALDLLSLPEWGFGRAMEYVLETRGAHGAVLHTREGRREIPPCPARVADTTGTGDSFAGGLLAGLLTHGDILRAAGEASACGALTAEVLGAAAAFGWEEVRRRAALAAPPAR